MIYLTLENHLCRFPDDSILCCDISYPSHRQAAASSPFSDLDKIINWSYIWNMSFNTDKSHALTVSLQKDRLANPTNYFFLTILLRKFSHSNFWVQSFGSEVAIPTLPMRYDLCWANHISKMASKASRRLDILHRTKSFLGTPELLSTKKAFIHSLMESCSSFWAGSSASHSAQIDVMKTKAFKIIVIYCAEAELMDISLSHHRQVCGVSVHSRLLSGLAL